jgi:hypothetical protein
VQKSFPLGVSGCRREATKAVLSVITILANARKYMSLWGEIHHCYKAGTAEFCVYMNSFIVPVWCCNYYSFYWFYWIILQDLARFEEDSVLIYKLASERKFCAGCSFSADRRIQSTRYGTGLCLITVIAFPFNYTNLYRLTFGRCLIDLLIADYYSEMSPVSGALL